MAFLEGWAKRKLHTITGSADGDQTNYQIRLTVYYGAGSDLAGAVYLNSGCKADFSDLRFTAADETTLLDYCIVSKTDSVVAVVDVKIPAISAASGATIYIYYGNASAADASNGTATYPLYKNNERPWGVVFANAATRLNIADTQGGIQTAHPSVLKFATAWNGHQYWMANTPYPSSNSVYENPCVYYADNETDWTAIAANPIVTKGDAGNAFNADTELVYNDSTDELWIYYKHYNGTITTCRAIKSANGTAWTDLTGGALNSSTNPGTLIIDFGTAEEVSYCVQKTAATTWKMWSVLASNKTFRYRTSSDGIVWSASSGATTRNRDGVAKAFNPWHMQIKYVPEKGKYLGMFNTGIASDLSRPYALFGESTSGTDWTIYPTILIEPVAGSWDATAIYRPSFIYDPADSKIKIWYSGADTMGALPDVWGTGYVEMDYDAMYTKLNDLDGWDEIFGGGLIDNILKSTDAYARSGTRAMYTKGIFDAFAPLGITGKFKFNVSMRDDGTADRQTLLQIMNATNSANFGVGWFGGTNNIIYNNGTQVNRTVRSVGWHDWELKFNGTAVSVSLDGDAPVNYTAVAGLATQVNAKIYSFGAGTTGIDEIYTRNYTPNEPVSTAWGAEESLATGDPQTITFGALTLSLQLTI